MSSWPTNVENQTIWANSTTAVSDGYIRLYAGGSTGYYLDTSANIPAETNTWEIRMNLKLETSAGGTAFAIILSPDADFDTSARIGFDGGNAVMFLQTYKYSAGGYVNEIFGSRQDNLGSNIHTGGVPFQFIIKCVGGNISFFYGNATTGQVNAATETECFTTSDAAYKSWPSNSPVYMRIRPHRMDTYIYDWWITGGDSAEPVTMIRDRHMIGGGGTSGTDANVDGTIAFVRFWNGTAINSGEVRKLYSMRNNNNPSFSSSSAASSYLRYNLPETSLQIDSDVMFNAVVIYREISATEYFPDRYWKNYLDFHELQCWVDGKNINSLSSIGSSDNVRITSDNINWTSNYQIPSLDSHRVASNGINEVIDLSNDEDNVRGYSLGNNMNEPLHFIVKHDTLYKVKDLEAVVFESKSFNWFRM